MEDSGASIFVLKLPTFTVLADHFLKRSKSPPSNTDFKTLTVANQFEVPISFNAILHLHTSIHGSNRTLVPICSRNTISYAAHKETHYPLFLHIHHQIEKHPILNYKIITFPTQSTST